MKRFISILALLMIPALLGPEPARADSVGQCSGTLQQIMTAGSCTFGNLTFSNFSYTPAGSNTVTSDQIMVGASSAPFPVGSLNGNQNIALQFTAPWSNSTMFNYEFTLTFDVTTLNSAGLVAFDLDLMATPPDRTGIANSASILTHPASGCAIGHFQNTENPEGFINFSDTGCPFALQGAFTNQTFVTLSTDINVPQMTFHFGVQTPEPATLSLVAVGLLATILRRRYRI